MMFREKRQEVILGLLDKNESLSVNYLARFFFISKETIRKDLSELAEKGVIQRYHGGARILRRVLLSEISKANQLNIEALLKKINSQKAINQKTARGDKMTGQVCILGSFNMDIVSKVARFPHGGESIMATSNTLCPGGKGANQALAASFADANVHFACKVGDDQFGQLAYEHLSSSNIDSLTLYKSATQPTGSAVIFVSEQNGENMIAIDSGANKTVTEDEVARLEPHLKQAGILLVQLENNIDATINAIMLAKALGVKVILNPAPYSDGILPYLHQVDIVTPNETEASLLSGIQVCDLNSARQAAEVIASHGVNTVLITLGSKGSLLYENNKFSHIPALPALAVDTTGAGDAFNGALSAAIAKGKNIHQAAVYATAFASLAVEREGASNMPSHQSVLQRLSQH
ncbi:ribokinase [Serratia sp. DD3]|nr:ribokinase [Serratia sp. DD3]